MRPGNGATDRDSSRYLAHSGRVLANSTPAAAAAATRRQLRPSPTITPRASTTQQKW